LNAAYAPNEQTPDMLIHEIQRRLPGSAPTPAKPVEPATAKTVPTEKPTDTSDPRVLLKRGRNLLALQKYEEADKACNQALAITVRWGLFEDTPEKLRRDLQRARQASEREESFK